MTSLGPIVRAVSLIPRGLYTCCCWLGWHFWHTHQTRENVSQTPLHTVARKHVVQPWNRSKTLGTGVSLNVPLLFSLENHCSQTCSAFDRILAGKKRSKSVSVEKWKAEEYRLYLFCVSMKLPFHNTRITLAKKSQMLQIFFFLRLNLDLHLYISFLVHANLIYVCNLMYTCTTLTFHMQIF